MARVIEAVAMFCGADASGERLWRPAVVWDNTQLKRQRGGVAMAEQEFTEFVKRKTAQVQDEIDWD